MRFFCTCDCRKARDDLDRASSEIRQLKADLGDLFDRHVRLQGRLAARVKVESGEPGGAPGEFGAAQRGNPVALELLAKRRGNAV